MAAESHYRHLVACGRCGLQFDASGRAAGSRFRCSCGEPVEVPAARPHDAAVVRCSACGGPRQQGISACNFCGSDFTLHERDLHTICPRCGTRISDRSRFCHSCAVPIAPQALAGEATRFACPACGDERRLRSRQLGDGDGLALLECESCAGLWLGSEIFRRLEMQARDRQGGDGLPGAARVEQRAEKPVYRACPICGQLMHRRNYGRRSGVIVDTCARDGLWFDRGELEAVLEWVRGGGPRRVQEQEREAARSEQRSKRVFAPLEPEVGPPRGPGSLARLVEWIVDALAS